MVLQNGILEVTSMNSHVTRIHFPEKVYPSSSRKEGKQELPETATSGLAGSTTHYGTEDIVIERNVLLLANCLLGRKRERERNNA